MRLLGTLAVLMACIIGTGFWLGCSLETSADKLSYQIDKVNAEIKRDCWEAAVEENAKLEQAGMEKPSGGLFFLIIRRWII